VSRPPLSGCFEPQVEDAVSAEPALIVAEAAAISIAISLKRIADIMENASADAGADASRGGLFGRIEAAIEHLSGVLNDASHNHAQRMGQ